MKTWHRRNRAMYFAGAAVALAMVGAGCSNDSDAANSSGGAGTGDFAQAQAEVDKFAANPPLKVEPLPERPATSTTAIQLNCTLPSCAPGAMQPAMEVLGWSFEEQTFDITEGPAALQQALTQAIAEDPDVIFIPGTFPPETLQAQVDSGVEQGIKFVTIGGTEEVPPGYSACIQCTPSAAALGALAANIALADAGDDINIAVAFDKTITPLVAEADGVKQQIEAIGGGSEVLDLEQSVVATPADNAAKVVSFLQRNPDVEYLILTSPQFNPATALASAGLSSRVKIVGMYPLSDADVAAVTDGQVIAYAAGEVASMYWRAADAAARAVSDLEVDPISPLQSMRVMDSSNADISLIDPADFQDVYEAAWQVQ
ncbi:hypothetical protein ACJ5H2_22905 (plasmid) [Nocardioides sp. R1-1]|uniref:hypothetical protein n=1 Tax=Nocardioides sp. R1-1 TaxID=3383502 RepID=UPI0038CFFE8C